MLALTGFALTGCRETLQPVESGAHVINQPGYFEYRTAVLTGATYQAVYLWHNTGTTAILEDSSAAASGEASITLTDPHGRVLYHAPLARGAAAPVGVGVSGSWSVIVTVAGFSGTVDLRLRQLWLPPVAPGPTE